MRIPFARTRVERAAKDDPRLSTEERYRNEREYQAAVKRAADQLFKERLPLKDDVDTIVWQAAEHYRAAVSTE